MKQNPQIQAKRVPDVGLSIVLRYLGTLTGLNLKACESFEDAIAEIVAEADNVPEGLDDAIPNYYRANLRSSLFNMKEKDTLVQSSLEVMYEDDGVYWLMSDATLSGKDSLFLVSCAINDTVKEATDNNLLYMVDSWGTIGKPANIISGSCRLKDGSVFSAVAVQLSSIAFRDSNIE